MAEISDPTGELAAARIAHVTQTPPRLARARQRLQRWLGLVELASAYRELAGAISRVADDVRFWRERHTQLDGNLIRLQNALTESEQLVRQLNSRITFYEQHSPHFRKARAEYDRLMKAMLESQAAPPQPPQAPQAPSPPPETP